MNKISRFAYRDSRHTYKSARVSNLLSPMQNKYLEMIAYKQDSYNILEHYIYSYLVSPYKYLVMRRAV